MVIDWFTIGAQILNFLVLVWLLKRFLYKPVLDAIDQREQRIAKSLAEAAEAKAQAASEREALQAKGAAFDGQRAELLAKAVADADAERLRLSAEARAAGDELKRQQSAALVQHAEALNAEIGRRTTAEVFAIARKAFADLADETLEDKMAALFIRRLGALEAPDKSSVGAMLASTGGATIRSAFGLSGEQQSALIAAFRAAFGSVNALRFEVAPEQISGIELVGGGQKLSWSLADYLKTLERSVGDMLAPQAPETGATA